MSVQIKPCLTVDDAKRVVKDLFGFQVSNVQILTSYLDQNFKIECDVDGRGKVFNLKILNSDDSKHKELIEAEHVVFSLLKSQNITSPIPYCDGSRQSYFYIDAEYCVLKSRSQDLGEKYFIVRLLEFVPGKPIGDVESYNEELLFNVGSFAGHLDAALQEYHDKIFETRDCIWHLDKLKNYINRLEFVDVKRASVLMKAIEDFYGNVMSEEGVKQLRKGMMHCDFNETNILVDSQNELKISGIIDFGDAYYSFYVFEIAIASLYMILDASPPRCTLNQIEIAAHVIAGYVSIFKLNSHEYYSILTCIKARIAQSIMNSSYCSSLNPENTYVTVTQDKAWNLLCELNAKGDDSVYNTWNKILKEKYNINDY